MGLQVTERRLALTALKSSEPGTQSQPSRQLEAGEDTDTDHAVTLLSGSMRAMQSTGPSRGVWKSFGEEGTLGSRSGGLAGINRVRPECSRWREEEVQRSQGVRACGAPRSGGKIRETERRARRGQGQGPDRENRVEDLGVS